MSNIPADLKYTKDHEWIRDNGDGTGTVGITDYAQQSLGDITYVELPSPGSAYQAGDTFGVVESVKAASDLFMPMDAEVLEVNAALGEAPEAVNQDPYGEGWILKVKLPESGSNADLLDAGQYGELV